MSSLPPNNYEYCYNRRRNQQKKVRDHPPRSKYFSLTIAVTGSSTAILGTRLEPSMDLMEFQPEKLKELIIVKLTTMLDNKVTMK